MGEERGQGVLSVPGGVAVQGPGEEGNQRAAAKWGRGVGGRGGGWVARLGIVSAGRVVGLAQAQQWPCLFLHRELASGAELP